eukprot:gene51987-57182_t
MIGAGVDHSDSPDCIAMIDTSARVPVDIAPWTVFVEADSDADGPDIAQDEEGMKVTWEDEVLRALLTFARARRPCTIAFSYMLCT